MKSLLAALAGVALLAACGGDDDDADLPAGQYDLGSDISVTVRAVKDPVPDSDGHVVAVDLEYFNRGDDPVPMNMAFRVELHDSTGRSGTPVAVDLPRHGSVIPSESSARGWEAFRIADDAEPAELVLWGAQTGADAKPITVDVPKG